MPDIMSSFVFQASRRALLTHLLNTFNEASRHRDEHIKLGMQESDDEKRHIDNLLSAEKAADEQVKKLEYWSDIREMAATSESNEYDQWQRFHSSESKGVVSTRE